MLAAFMVLSGDGVTLLLFRIEQSSRHHEFHRVVREGIHHSTDRANRGGGLRFLHFPGRPAIIRREAFRRLKARKDVPCVSPVENL